MGEARAPGRMSDTNRNLIISTSVVVVVSLIVLLVFFRSCGLYDRNAGYKVIYSNLDLKDAANVVTVLKVMKIPYQIRDDGRTVAVPKDKADDAKLGLAEKNLPTGGSVGWEIFDQSKLGTTDFDRRVQFVRAISGELARTIMRIDAVLDARVQIVIPQTSLFEVAKAPVTASVLLQLRTGRKISREQVNGIVYLVASSVENLRPENVIIVDIYGNILSGPGVGSVEANVVASPVTEQMYIAPTQEVAEKAPVKEILISKTVPTGIKETAAIAQLAATKETETISLPQKKLTVEEKVVVKFKAKEEFENMLSSKVQKVVNNFYPPNSILVKVNVDLAEYKESPKKHTATAVKAKKHVISSMENGKKPVPSKMLTEDNIKKMTVIVLVDNRFNLTKQQKKTTYEMIGNAISYHPSRGDRIILRQVPFHYATAFQPGMMQKGSASKMESKRSLPEKMISLLGQNTAVSVLAALFIFLLAVLAARTFSRRRSLEQEAEEMSEPDERMRTASSAIEQIRTVVAQSPDRVAELMKNWLSEK
ncbi:MAG: flagellar basal-body MS-ring/collar protein FliF [Candidatus Saganbacteria bacterium]|nr:flagellar basal-body MS-ring/collar protein FliF [Candidatus Saganbacteria bacterium]